MRTIQEHRFVSIVIPTLNAAEFLPGTLVAAANSEIVREIIVADGGSHDETVAIAQQAGAAVITAPRGRGSQLAAGAGAAGGPWVLFLHADCRLQPGWTDAIVAFVSRPYATSYAGYFALRLDDEAWAARFLERVVTWRSQLLGLPYGDQGLLIPRTLYEAVGGFAPLPLMEDVDLVRRLGRRRLRPLDGAVTASARRYQRDGYLRRPLRNLLCLGLYFIGVPPRHIVRLYG
jgi:rSAM/selenodomain-associated transferase 2